MKRFSLIATQFNSIQLNFVSKADSTDIPSPPIVNPYKGALSPAQKDRQENSGGYKLGIYFAHGCHYSTVQFI